MSIRYSFQKHLKRKTLLTPKLFNGCVYIFFLPHWNCFTPHKCSLDSSLKWRKNKERKYKVYSRYILILVFCNFASQVYFILFFKYGYTIVFTGKAGKILIENGIGWNTFDKTRTSFNVSRSVTHKPKGSGRVAFHNSCHKSLINTVMALELKMHLKKYF